MAVAIAVVALSVFLFGGVGAKSRIYDEEKFFANDDDYCILLDEDGKYKIMDMLCRYDGSVLLHIGTYEIQESLFSVKLVLNSYHEDGKLVFFKDEDNWVFDKNKSYGYENLKFDMQDKSVWAAY